MVRAKKSLGQNFLQDPAVIAKIVAALGLTSKDTVIEIGPGLGALTALLLDDAERVVAVEFDSDMAAYLDKRFGPGQNFHLHNVDALGADFATLAGGRCKLVANLPYNISTPILQRLIEQREIFDVLVLMFQREVVERITATAGSSDRGFLTVLVEDAFEVERLFDIEPTAFKPVPKVWSSVVRLTPRKSIFENPIATRRLLSTAFAQKRKTILNNLKGTYLNADLALREAGIDKNRRAETLARGEWKRLGQALAKLSQN